MATIKRYTNGAWEEVAIVPEVPEVTDVVKTTSQELADEEKIQARENIDAASIAYVDAKFASLVDGDEVSY